MVDGEQKIIPGATGEESVEHDETAFSDGYVDERSVFASVEEFLDVLMSDNEVTPILKNVEWGDVVFGKVEKVWSNGIRIRTGNTSLTLFAKPDGVKQGDNVFAVIDRANNRSALLVDIDLVAHAIRTVRDVVTRVLSDEEKPSPTLSEYLSCLFGMSSVKVRGSDPLVRAGKVVHNALLPLLSFELELVGCDTEVENGRWIEVEGRKIYVEPDLVARCGGKTIVFELKFSNPRSRTTLLRYAAQIMVYSWVVGADYACLVKVNRDEMRLDMSCIAIDERIRRKGFELISFAVRKCGDLQKVAPLDQFLEP